MSVASFLFDIAFDAAIAFARRRGVVLPSIFYADLQDMARAAAFTVSGIEALDELQDVLDSLDDALTHGISFAEWQREAVVQVMSPARRELVFRNAVQTAYSVGRTEQQREFAHLRPYLMWDAINDARTRPAHAAMDGFVAPVSDPTWLRWCPPAGHNCRCTRISLTESQARARGYPMPAPVAEPDPGWDYEKADADTSRLDALLEQRIARAPTPIRDAARRRHR